MDWFDLLAVQGTLKSFLQQHSSKASIFQCSAFLQFLYQRYISRVVFKKQIYEHDLHMSSYEAVNANFLWVYLEDIKKTWWKIIINEYYHSLKIYKLKDCDPGTITDTLHISFLIFKNNSKCLYFSQSGNYSQVRLINVFQDCYSMEFQNLGPLHNTLLPFLIERVQVESLKR